MDFTHVTWKLKKMKNDKVNTGIKTKCLEKSYVRKLQ